MKKKIDFSTIAIFVAVIIAVGIAGYLVFTFFSFVIRELNTDYTYKTVERTAIIKRMEYEPGEWEKKPKTKEVKKSDGSKTTETVYVDVWDEPEYEIDIEYKDKNGKTEMYYYEEEESSELYDYLKDAGLIRGDKLDAKVTDTYGNGEYRHSSLTDVKVPKDTKFRDMLN